MQLRAAEYDSAGAISIGRMTPENAKGVAKIPSQRCRLSIPDIFFFFSSRRRHTRFKCDWSSDVCSSDLRVPKLRVSPEIRHCRSLRRPSSGGSIEVPDNGEGTLVRPGSWSGAKAQEGSPEDLRDPIRVDTRGAGWTGNRSPKARAWKGPPTFPGRCGEHEAGGIGWAAGANQ